jgi:splicing factor 3B subunit 3
MIPKRQQGKRIDEDVVNLPPDVFGRPKAAQGTWGSAIRIIDPVEAKTVNLIHLDANEAAFSIAVIPFAARNGELHLVVGTAADTHIAPRSCSSGYLRTYTFSEDGTGLELLHKVRFETELCVSTCADGFLVRPKSTTFLWRC